MMNKTLVAAAVILTGIGSSAQAMTQLDVVAWKGNIAQPAGLPELIERFEEQNPDIKVDLSYVSRKDVDKVVPPRLQSGNPPDVTMVDASLVALWGGAGFLSDLGEDHEWYKEMLPSVKKVMTLDGKVLAYPLEIIGMGNFVNMDLLKKAGIDEAPVTIDELKTACTALADKGISPMIFSGGFSAMLYVGANGINPKGPSPAEFGNGEVKFADDANYNAALDSVRDLVAAKCFDPKLQAALDPWATAPQAFRSGKVAMLPQGAWNISDFAKVDGLNFEFAPMPSSFSNDGLALDLVGPGWAIPKDAAHAEAARKWIDFFAKPENLNVFLSVENAYSPYSGDATPPPKFSEPYTAARKAGDVILWPFSNMEFPKQLQSEWENSLTGFLLNIEKPNKDTLDRWDESVEDSL